MNAAAPEPQSGFAVDADGGSSPGIPLPEVAVAPHVFVLPLPATDPPDRIVQQWLELDRAEGGASADDADVAAGSGSLADRRDELLDIVAAASGPAQPGEVAAFLSYRCRAGRLVGGAALLTLELLEPRPGLPAARAASLAIDLRGTADGLGHVDGLAQVETRRTASGVPAVRLRFLAVAGPSERSRPLGASAESDAPMVEACRWLYPVPGHADLAWSLVFQTTDIVAADGLVAEFDQLAGSLAWVVP